MQHWKSKGGGLDFLPLAKAINSVLSRGNLAALS
jgi:hypothetical protein